jgi:membrane protein YqaA with SNARE-associated domain
MDAVWHTLLASLALPEWGLPALFLVATISATLLPMGSEPALFGLIKLEPSLLWPALAVATAGNTLGGAISWWMGYGAERAWEQWQPGRVPQARALLWLQRFGARACLLSWLPIVGDPLCAVAGWLRLPFWPCVAYMLVGKGLRYLVMTAVLLWWFPGQW